MVFPLDFSLYHDIRCAVAYREAFHETAQIGKNREIPSGARIVRRYHHSGSGFDPIVVHRIPHTPDRQDFQPDVRHQFRGNHPEAGLPSLQVQHHAS